MPCVQGVVWDLANSRTYYEVDRDSEWFFVLAGAISRECGTLQPPVGWFIRVTPSGLGGSPLLPQQLNLFCFSPTAEKAMGLIGQMSRVPEDSGELRSCWGYHPGFLFLPGGDVV